jgi:hypothetical protein
MNTANSDNEAKIPQAETRAEGRHAAMAGYGPNAGDTAGFLGKVEDTLRGGTGWVQSGWPW